MITRDKSIFDDKVAEVCRFSESNNYICIDREDFEKIAEGTKEQILIELESKTGFDDLMSRMTSALDSIQKVYKCEVIMHIVTNSMIMSDFAKVDKALDRCKHKFDHFKRGIAYDEGLVDGQHKLTLFLYIKGDNK